VRLVVKFWTLPIAVRWREHVVEEDGGDRIEF